jgi:hypothetical protein
MARKSRGAVAAERAASSGTPGGRGDSAFRRTTNTACVLNALCVWRVAAWPCDSGSYAPWRLTTQVSRARFPNMAERFYNVRLNEHEQKQLATIMADLSKARPARAPTISDALRHAVDVACRQVSHDGAKSPGLNG